jgi:ABC-type amino acid transport substrate-binding protein
MEHAALEALINSEIDYVIADHNPAKIWALENTLQNQLLFGEMTAPRRGVYLIASKDGPYSYLNDEINQRLSAYHSSGLVQHINNSYLKEWVANPCE